MRREIIEIPLSQLTISKLNVRRHGGRDVASLARSITEKGLFYPLLVRETAGAVAGGHPKRPTKTAFEIVAGKRRYLALQKNKAEHAPCILLDAGDDASAIEASLLENSERLPMDELDQFDAFAKLAAEGRDVKEIAFTFSLPVAQVRQRLALSNLVSEAKSRYRQGDIDARTLHVLTLGTKERQRAYLRLIDDPDQSPPPFWQMKAWMLGTEAIETKAALFDLALYTGAITSDLFGETSYFSDTAQFWDLQRAAIAALKSEHESNGWQTVTVLEPDAPFYAYKYEAATKAQGGHVVIKLNADGTADIHKGIAPQSDMRARARKEQRESTATTGTRAAASGAGSDPTVTAEPENTRAEMTAALTNYCDLVRHATVQAALVKKPKIALRLMVASMIAGAPYVHVSRDPRSPVSTEIGTSLAAMTTTPIIEEARSQALVLLGFEASADGPAESGPASGRTGHPKRDQGDSLSNAAVTGHSLPDVFLKLLDLSDAQVLVILAVIAADSLASGSPVVETAGITLEADCSRHWTPDKTFFDLVRGKAVIEGMAREVLGKFAPHALDGTQARAKDKIREAVEKGAHTADAGKAKWQPRYTRFPRGAYHAAGSAKPTPAERTHEPVMEAAG